MNPEEPTVALVFSPERWVEELHRYLADHGGARVRQIVVEPSVALDEEYDTLVVSDRWPALTHGLVDALHQRSRGVLGVFDPDEPAGKDHLLGLGVDATIAADSPMAEFVTALAELGPRELASDLRGRGAGTAGGESRTALDEAAGSPGRLTVVGGPRGSGVTEVALALAAAVARRRESAVLVDAHETARGGRPSRPRPRTQPAECGRGRGPRTRHARALDHVRQSGQWLRRRERLPEPDRGVAGDAA